MSKWPKSHLVATSGIYPKGFVAGAVHGGIKKKAGVLDMTLVVSDRPCTAAAVFTKNAFAAAPVLADRKILAMHGNGGVRGIFVNSGCANACTGDAGLADAWATSAAIDAALSPATAGATRTPTTLVMSTGVIGQPLNMSKILSGVSQLTARGSGSPLSATHDGWLSAAEGIMTTDTFPKLRSVEFASRVKKGLTYRMAGWCKGAGMIHPNMATMLGAVFTDAFVSQRCLERAVRHAADRSFNAISVDGDTSTNDTFAVLANGAASDAAAGAFAIADEASPEFAEFQDNLTTFSTELAQLIVRDGEGATKFIKIAVEGAKSFEDAKTIASTIATSPLVKTAIYGKDANWGRIVCAVGYSGVEINPEKVNLYFSNKDGSKSLHLFKNGAPFDVNEEVAAEILKDEDVDIRITLGLGQHSANMFTCDFSHEYISINADYRS
ncbi:hypothetical protein DFJ73DRAFT_806827 [Zopfochytrium polystomum]|nr:hypothetical protein DFJ73DRAFT_806827 [Zopfochytrium polystomum]